MTKLSALRFSIILQLIFSSAAYCQLSFAPPDTLQYTGAGRFGTYRNGNAYPVDFNHDGLDDIIFMKGNQVTRKLNLGGNKFGPEKIMYQDQKALFSISNLVDINKDTYPDLVISSVDGLKILLSDNDKYIKAMELKTQVSYRKMVLRDFDNDNQVDLACAAGSDIVLYKGISNGFGTQSVLFSAASSVYDFELRDLNKDTFADLVINGDVFALKILWGDASNNWTPVYSHAGSPFSHFEIGDLNLDGFLDVTFLDPNNNIMLALKYNNGTHAFDEQSIFGSGPLPENMFTYQLIDLRGNGTFDLVYIHFYTLSARLNDGTGQFTAEVPLASDQNFPQNFSIFNLNNDGVPDMIVSDVNSYSVFSFSANGNVDATITGGYFDDFRDVLANDQDADGFLDMISISRTGTVQIRWGNAEHNYKSSVTNLEIPNDCYYGMVVDATGDGLMDILITRETNTNAINEVILLEAKGQRAFKEAVSWKYFPDPGKPRLLDLNKDGKKEWVTFARYGQQVGWLNFANQDFNEFFTNSITVTTGNVIAMADGDVNHDGYVDLLTANANTKDVTLLLNNKAGGFTSQTILPNGTISDIVGIQTFDYNSDQFDDVLLSVSVNATSVIQVLLNDKNGNLIYTTSHELTDIYNPEKILPMDLDGDGDQDFVVSGWDHNAENIFLNFNGIYKKQEKGLIKQTNQSARLYTDVNDDNLPDIFSGMFIFGDVFLQLNNTVFEPQLNKTVITITDIALKGAKIKLNTAGTSGRLVILSKGEIFSGTPQDNQLYASNPQFGIGTSLGTDSYVVHAGTSEVIEITGLTSSTKYVVSVFEYNVNKPQSTIINYGTSKVSMQFTTLNSPPVIAAVADQSGLNLEAISVSLNITDEDNLIKDLTYVVKSSNVAVIPVANVVLNLESTPSVLRIQPLAEGESQLEVKVTDPAGNNASVSFHYTSLIVGLEDERVSKFLALPNPFSSTITLQHPRRDQSVSIYNSTGQLLKQFSFIHESVDLSDLPTGLYMFVTADGLRVKALKL